MPPLPRRLLPGVLLTLILLPGSVRGQVLEPREVTIQTVDEVNLRGVWYPSDRAAKAPVVLLLHNISGSSGQDGWEDLARELNKKGMAVLTFDFRGHGKSVGVEPPFWKANASRIIKNANPKKEQVSARDFPPAYLPMLVNDIASARRFIDEKNDNQECNSSNLIVIAAQEGATLGALWLAAEWQRRAPRRAEGTVRRGPPGEDVATAVWLSFSPTLGRQPVPADKWIKPQRDRTPMAFLYGEDDKRAAAVAVEMCDQVLKIDVPPRARLTAAKAVKGKGAGHELLEKSSGARESIANYLSKVLEARGEQDWYDREAKRAKHEFVNLKPHGFPLP